MLQLINSGTGAIKYSAAISIGAGLTLSETSDGIAHIADLGVQVTGSGTTNVLPKFSSVTGLTNSAISENGTTVSVTLPFSTRMVLGTDTIGAAGAPGDVNIQRVYSKFVTGSTSQYNLSAFFYTEQTASSAQTGGIQGVESIVATTHGSGSVVIALPLIGTVEVAAAGTLTGARAIMGAVTMSSTGGGTDASAFYARMAGRFGGGTGTYTNGYMFYGESFGAGFTNKYGIYISDTSALNLFAGPVQSLSLDVTDGTTVAGGFTAALKVRNGTTGYLAASDGTHTLVAGATGGTPFVGAGTNHGLDIRTNNSARITITASGVILGGLGSTDVSVNPGAIVSIDSLVSVTAATNASVASLAAIAGNYVALGSNKTGSGTYLPIAFFTSGVQRATLDTSGNFAVQAKISEAGWLYVNNQGTFGFGGGGDARAALAFGATDNAEDWFFGQVTSSARGVSNLGLYNFLGAGWTFNMRPDGVFLLLNGNTSTDVSVGGGSLVSIGSIVSVTATTNASVASLAAIAGNYVALGSNKTGSGTYLPMAFFTSATERFRLTTIGEANFTTQLGLTGNNSQLSNVNGLILWGGTNGGSVYARGDNSGGDDHLNLLAVNDIILQPGLTARMRLQGSTGATLFGLSSTDVSVNPGAVVSVDALISVTATANASVGSFAAVASTYVALSSSKTGSGTYLPLAFFTSATQQFSIATSGAADFHGNTVTVGSLITNGTVSLHGGASAYDLYGRSGDIQEWGIYCPSGNDLRFYSYQGVGDAFALSTGGILKMGLVSTDVSVNAGAIVSIDAFVSVTGTTNASIGSFAAISGNYVAIASSRTGSGTFLPMVFFTNGSECGRFTTGSDLQLKGRISTADPGHGSGAWKLGTIVSATVSLVTSSYVEIDIGGTTVKLARVS